MHITSLSNLSTGFCPEPGCLAKVMTVLSTLQMDLSDCTLQVFKFRRCVQCQNINVIKDEDPDCAVCNAPLPEEWNF